MLINILKLSLQCNNLPLFLKIIENICIRGETSLCRRKRNEQKYNYKQLLREVVSTSFQIKTLSSRISYSSSSDWQLVQFYDYFFISIYIEIVVFPHREKIIVSFYVHSYRTFSPREKKHEYYGNDGAKSHDLPACQPWLAARKKLAH